MNVEPRPLKDENSAHPIPLVWRRAISEIVDVIRSGFLAAGAMGESVAALSDSKRTLIAKNIHDYGVTLVALPDASWETSMCQWMRDYWDVLVDLYSAEEGRSDLVLQIRVFENGGGFLYEIESVYVP